MQESDSMKSKQPTVAETKDNSDLLVQVFPLLTLFASYVHVMLCE